MGADHLIVGIFVIIAIILIVAIPVLKEIFRKDDNGD